MKTIITVLLLTAGLAAQQPEPTVNKKFLVLAGVSAATTFSDSYTTLFATQNWHAGRQGVCNEEVESAWLYGRHPEAPRTYAVAVGKTGLAAAASYVLRKHHNRFWAAPMMALTGISAQGVAQNIVECK